MLNVSSFYTISAHGRKDNENCFQSKIIVIASSLYTISHIKFFLYKLNRNSHIISPYFRQPGVNTFTHKFMVIASSLFALKMVLMECMILGYSFHKGSI